MVNDPDISRMDLVASFEDFQLYDRHEYVRGWHNLKLVRTTEDAPKRAWVLGWNGKRISDGRDAKLLREFHPKIYGWVIETAKKVIAQEKSRVSL